MKKKLKIVIIVSAFLVVSLTTAKALWNTQNNLQNNLLENDDTNETKVEQNVFEDSITDENVINIEVHPFYGHEPNVEFLMNSSDLIVFGTIDTSSLVSEVEDSFIYTNMAINVTKVLKNNSISKFNDSTESNLNSLNIRTMGGKLSAKDYINSLGDSSKEKFSLTKEEVEKYSFSLDTSNGKLKYNEQNVEYIFFLKNMNGNWTPNSNHYGIRKIEDNKVYDYDTDTYIEIDLLN